jgi:hypothetical protein
MPRRRHSSGSPWARFPAGCILRRKARPAAGFAAGRILMRSVAGGCSPSWSSVCETPGRGGTSSRRSTVGCCRPAAGRPESPRPICLTCARWRSRGACGKSGPPSYLTSAIGSESRSGTTTRRPTRKPAPTSCGELPETWQAYLVECFREVVSRSSSAAGHAGRRASKVPCESQKTACRPDPITELNHQNVNRCPQGTDRCSMLIG